MYILIRVFILFKIENWFLWKYIIISYWNNFILFQYFIWNYMLWKISRARKYQSDSIRERISAFEIKKFWNLEIREWCSMHIFNVKLWSLKNLATWYEDWVSFLAFSFVDLFANQACYILYNYIPLFIDPTMILYSWLFLKNSKIHTWIISRIKLSISLLKLN